MRGPPEQIDRALSGLALAVSAALLEQGWQRRDLDDHSVVTLTRDMGDGLMATAELSQISVQWPEKWPVEVEVAFGVGYEPALNLMPLLTLDPRVALLNASDGSDRSMFTVILTQLGDVDAACRRIVAGVTERAVPYAQQFSGAPAIEAVLSAPSPPYLRPPPRDADLDVRQFYSDYVTRPRLLLLATTGRHDQARALLSTYPSQRENVQIDQADRRFIRQLTRWLDAGGPAAPPIAQTLAQLPRNPKPRRPSWEAARERSKQRRAAIDAVQARITDGSVEQITALLVAEYAHRGIDISSSELAVTAQAMHVEHDVAQQPFGRVRSRLRALRMLKDGATDVIRAVKNDPDDTPGWLTPPERAGYHMTRGNTPATAVTLDPDAHGWLTRAWTETPRHVGMVAGVDVWLTTENHSADLIAHIGQRRVGTISAPYADAYQRELHAAALFDEDPVTHGLLIRIQDTGPLILEIPTPAQQAPS